MSKAGQIRRKTTLERLAAEKVHLTHAVFKLRDALMIVAKGENWAFRPGTGRTWYGAKRTPQLLWVGEENPQEILLKAMKEVFGPVEPEKAKP